MVLTALNGLVQHALSFCGGASESVLAVYASVFRA